MRPHMLLLCAAISLAGCGTTPPPAPAQPICPPFRAWSDADLASLGNALQPIPEGSPIMRMALDWRRYYGDAKACSAPHVPQGAHAG